MTEVQKNIGRLLANAYYEYQGIRISLKNQVRDVIRKRVEGISFNEVEEKKEVKSGGKYSDIKLVKMWNLAYQQEKITTDEYSFLLKAWEMAKEGKLLEDKYKRLMNKYVESEPIYIEYLSEIKGIGPVISANLIKDLGYCERFDTVSKLWAYTGNHVVNGKAPKREKGKKLGFNIRLKTFTWKISDSLMKSNKGYYRKLYLTEKQKQEAKVYEKGYLFNNYNGYKEDDIKLSKGHVHNRAMRKVRKHFLSHYWEASRELMRLPTEKTYVEGVLNHNHIIHWKDAIKMEGCLKVNVNQTK